MFNIDDKQQNKQLYVIKGYKLFRFLQSKGFKLVKQDIDRNNRKFNVFLFEKSEQLLKAIDEFMRIKKEY